MTTLRAITVTAIALAVSVGESFPEEVGQAAEILQAAGVKGGLVVHIRSGVSGGAGLTAALRANERYVVHALVNGASDLAAVRTGVRNAGLDASVWVSPLAGGRLPYAENMVNLLVAEGLGEISMDEVRRVLVPNGVAQVKTSGKWVRTVKPRGADIDEWTHWLHGADGNAVAADARVGPPRSFKWVASPLWSRSHDSVPSVSAMVSAGGRVFYIVDEAPASMSGSAPDKWALVARDAFNGLKLWSAPIGQWGWTAWSTRATVRFTVPTHVSRRLVAVGDRVYVTLGFNAPLTELDAATGKVLRTFEGTRFTDEILCDGDLLIVAINKSAQKPGAKLGASPLPVRKRVAAIDRKSGRMIWKTGDYVGLRSKTGSMERISHLSMSAGGGRVFFVDGGKIVSLNQKDGSEAWRIDRPKVLENKMRYNIRITDMCTLVYNNGTLYFAQMNPDRGIDWREIRARVHALSAGTGKEIWSRQCSSWGWAHPADVFILQGLVWVTDFQSDFLLGLDPKTGKVKRKVSNHKAFDNGHHHRCYRNKATSRYMITSFRGLEYIDWKSGRTDRNHWVRGVCRFGVIPCNGLTYSTPHPCDCYISSKLNGFLALKASVPAKAPGDGPKLDKGPAYGEIADRQSKTGGGQAWPIFRGDSRRSGSTSSAIPESLKTLWRADLGGGALTAPVTAGGRVIVARKAAREAVCLAAADGKVQWRYTAGGMIDTPPTIHGGRAVFGCTDGWVYCLRASDGVLVWRFRAAPRDRLVGAFGAIESAWPVHGSVLVADGKVYCTAGRSSFLDGGIYACALDLDSGEVVASETISSTQDMDVDWGRDQSMDTGALSDLLVADKGGIYLRHLPLLGRGRNARIPMHLRATGGFLDYSWFQRTRWFLDGAAVAEYLVFDDKRVFGVRARKAIGGYGLLFTPGGKGFELFAADRITRLPSLKARPKRKPGPPKSRKTGRPSGKSKTPVVRPPTDKWRITVPVRVTAMILAGDTLVAAGTPDVIYPTDPWAAYEGGRGGKLLVVSAADGTIKSELKLISAPVPDALAAASGRLLMSTLDGTVTCFGAK
ncbi:MAG: PQQ-binding-like beta-propeller repeat protein [Phycisphaerae bacterium]|nr:PQQ-binding-like beta-propeller repeat protein [Phycisphaerae bacterium]